MAQKAELSHAPVGSDQKATSNTETVFEFCPTEFLG